MRLFRRNPSTGADWSKDYIEHLRSVHFALIIVSITGIVVSRVPDTTELHVAQEQLRAIRDFVENVAPKSGVDADAKWFQFTFEGKKYATSLDEAVGVVEDGCAPKLHPLSFEWVESQFALSDTLDAFQKRWTAFHCRLLRIYPIRKVATSVMTDPTVDLTRAPVSTSDGPPKGAEVLDGVMIFDSRVYEIINAGVPLDASSMLGGAQTWRIQFKPYSSTDFFEGEAAHPYAAFKALQLPHMQLHFFFVYSADFREKKERTLQDAFLKVRQPRWRDAMDFSDMAGVLTRIAKGRTHYKLRDLSDWLNEEVARYERKDLEIVGVKFPMADESRWGIVVIFAILSYFWLHLSELSTKAEIRHTGLDVPWIGLYRSLYASILIWITVLGLPTIAVFFFVGAIIHYSDGVRWYAMFSQWRVFPIWVTALAVGCLILSMASCVKVTQLARLAAQLRQASTPKKTESNEDTGSAAKSST
jgi:hypothetical protein